MTFYIQGKYFEEYLKHDISFLLAKIFAISNKDTASLLKLKNILLKEENEVFPFIFYFQLSKWNAKLFSQIVYKEELKQFEQTVLSWNDDFYQYIDYCFDLSIMFSLIDNNKSMFYFTKAINDGRLRHGWRKDNIVSVLLVEALEILWKNNWLSKDKLKKYSNKVFDIALRVTQITDGKGTWYGSYNVIKLVADYDIDLAEKMKNKLISTEGRENFSNSVISSILKAKAKSGCDYDEIENAMQEYRKRYDYEHKPFPDYYEQKFVVYLAIAECELYTDEERVKAFESAYQQIKDMKRENISYFLRDSFEQEKMLFNELCKKYNKKSNIKIDKKEAQKKPKFSEEDFINKITSLKTKSALQRKYDELKDHNNDIVLKNYDSWKVLVERTFEINGDIQLFIKLIKECYFPHFGFWTSNSKYFHFGLATALNNSNTRQEALNYLYENTGHGGFLNIMRTYEVLEDKDMCLNLFKRYVKFCELLVE